VTLVIGIVAIWLAWPQFSQSSDPNALATLKDLETRRLPQMLRATDPIQREGVGLSVYGRQLDRALPKDARVFLSGMVGKENASRGGYYFFLRNYLFPRKLEISLGQPAVYKSDGSVWVDGNPCDSPDVLRTNGFDLFLRFGNDNNIQIIPLTQKGVPSQ
jgi:hypothetical protein